MHLRNKDAALPIAPNYKTDGRGLPYLVLKSLKMMYVCLKTRVLIKSLLDKAHSFPA